MFQQKFEVGREFQFKFKLVTYYYYIVQCLHSSY